MAFKSERSDWLFLGRDFAIPTVSVETVQAVYFSVQLKLRQENMKKYSLTSNSKRRRRQIFTKRIFIIPKNRETEISTSESRVAIDDFIRT